MNNQNKVTDLYAPPQAITIIEQQQVVPLSYFGTNGRIGRLRYIAWITGCFLLFVIGYFILLFIAGILFIVDARRNFADVPSGMLSLVFLIVIVIALSFIIRCTMQRLQDFDYNKWLALFLLVPFINVLLSLVCLIVPGSAESNKYGPPPPPDSMGVIILAVVSFIFFLSSLISLFFSVV